MTSVEEKKEFLVPNQNIILFIGPEGSGKTTISKQLAVEFNMPYITTGDIIRDLAEYDDGPLGDECRAMFAADTYLDGNTLLKILTNRFSKDDTLNGFVLDGGLRTLEETLKFPDMLDSAGRAFPLTVIYLQIPEEKSLERLVTGINARKRDRDTTEGVSSRLNMFYKDLEERLVYIASQPNWQIIDIDAIASQEVVYLKVADSLKESLLPNLL